VSGGLAWLRCQLLNEKQTKSVIRRTGLKNIDNNINAWTF